MMHCQQSLESPDSPHWHKRDRLVLPCTTSSTKFEMSLLKFISVAILYWTTERESYLGRGTSQNVPSVAEQLTFCGFFGWIFHESKRQTSTGPESRHNLTSNQWVQLSFSDLFRFPIPYDPLCWRINQHLALKINQSRSQYAPTTLLTRSPNGPTFAQERGKGTGLHHQPGEMIAALSCAIC